MERYEMKKNFFFFQYSFVDRKFISFGYIKLCILQVEDFINTTSTSPMSSVPIQFLIEVITPNCSQVPVVIPLTGCLDVQVNVSVTFTLYALNYCNRTVSMITSLSPTTNINGMTVSSLVNSTTNISLVYVTLTWTPQASQIGSQEFCAVAYTR
jgi:hypothetical protein